MKQAIIICGPTASGKSQAGHYFARAHQGEILNIDSMQVYKEIPIITASPTQDYTSELPYHLYNFLSIDQEFSVIKYLNIACEKIQGIASKGKLPIIIGGTGLYINSLLFGYNNIPDISSEVREYTRKLHEKIGAVEFFNQLQRLDSLIASRILPKDTTRTLRAYEVFKQTGKSIFFFQKLEQQKPLPDFNFTVFFLYPERKFLYETCNKRLERIFNQGAIEEIAAIKERLEDLTTSATKALGVQEIMAYLNDNITLETALTLTQAKTRQYAKRQITWFKHQLKEKITLQYANIEEFNNIIYNYPLLK